MNVDGIVEWIESEDENVFSGKIREAELCRNPRGALISHLTTGNFGITSGRSAEKNFAFTFDTPMK